MKRSLLTFVLLCFAGLCVSACHTVSGVGKDVKSAGEAIQGASGKK